MSICIIVVGINEWEKHTKPFLDSLRKHEPDVRCVVVDVISEPPYSLDGYENMNLGRFCKNVSFSRSLNFGAELADNPDWYVFVNNDVLIHKPFVERIEKLDPKQLYGFAFHSLDGWKYLSSWLLFVSSYVWDKIDKFDEALYPMWFEDADYSIRCTKADIPLSLQEREDWGFQHLEDERIKERKQKINTHIMERRANRNYVRRKHGL